MGRELQKKKNRSGVNKVRMKPKSKKTAIVKNPILAANWDKSQTLQQNFKRLGLTAKLNKTTGGVERKISDVERMRKEAEQGQKSGNDPLSIVGQKKSETLNVKETKIERDPTTGRILKIIETDHKNPNPLNDPLNDLDSDAEDDDDFLGFNEHASNVEGTIIAKASDKDTQVVRELEYAAARPVKKFKPHQSEGERAFIEELVTKYGDDYAKMARDIKINYMQRSEGDLKRRVQKWKKEGGRL